MLCGINRPDPVFIPTAEYPRQLLGTCSREEIMVEAPGACHRE